MGYGDTTVVLPTLNEERTVARLIREIRAGYRGISVIVVDDGSTDGTADAVRRVSRTDGSIAFIERGRAGLRPGLTASVLEGIRRSRTRFVIVMDADMQHPVATIEKIHAELLKGSAIAVAVRRNTKDWPVGRKAVSRTLMLFGYIILLLRRRKRTSDIFSGYFGIAKVKVYRIIRRNRRRFVGEGYKVLFDLLKCIGPDDGITISEIPYAFGCRRFGTSKANAAHALALLKSFFS